MKAQDVRYLRICKRCKGLGDGRRMLSILAHGQYHDHCVVEMLSHKTILRLLMEERAKITIGAAGVDLMRKLLDAREAEPDQQPS